MCSAGGGGGIAEAPEDDAAAATSTVTDVRCMFPSLAGTRVSFLLRRASPGGATSGGGGCDGGGGGGGAWTMSFAERALCALSHACTPVSSADSA